MSTMTHGPSEDFREKRLGRCGDARGVGFAGDRLCGSPCSSRRSGARHIVNNDAGGNSETIPTVVPVAIFAFLGTWVVARHGFRRSRD